VPLKLKRVVLAASILAATAAGGAGMALASDGQTPTPTHFVPLEDVVVPIVGSTRVEGTLRVRMVVEAADEGAAASVSDRMPELRATSLAAAVEHSRLYASALAPVNAERLRGDMTAALKRANPAVAGVLLTEVSAFPI
jgi:hypothetical protein